MTIYTRDILRRRIANAPIAEFIAWAFLVAAFTYIAWAVVAFHTNHPWIITMGWKALLTGTEMEW